MLNDDRRVSPAAPRASLDRAAVFSEAIRAVSDRAHSLALVPGTPGDAALFATASAHIGSARFSDARQDYVEPLRDALHRASVGASSNDWAGIRDDLADIAELGAEYLARF